MFSVGWGNMFSVLRFFGTSGVGPVVHGRRFTTAIIWLCGMLCESILFDVDDDVGNAVLWSSGVKVSSFLQTVQSRRPNFGLEMVRMCPPFDSCGRDYSRCRLVTKICSTNTKNLH